MSKISTLCFTLTLLVIGFSTGCRQAVTPTGTTLVPGTGAALPPPTAGTVAPASLSTSGGGASLGGLFGTATTRVTPPSTGSFNTSNGNAAAVPTNYAPQSSFTPSSSFQSASSTPIGSGVAQTSFQSTAPLPPAIGTSGNTSGKPGPRDGGMRVIDLTGGRQPLPTQNPASLQRTASTPNVTAPISPMPNSLRPAPNAPTQLEAFQAFDRSMPVNSSVQQAGFQASRPATSSSVQGSSDLQWRRPN